MSSQYFTFTLKSIAIVFFVGLFLFIDSYLLSPDSLINAIIVKVAVVCNHSPGQWFALPCIMIYLLVFALIKQTDDGHYRLALTNHDFWLMSMPVLSVLIYFANYARDSRPDEMILMLLGVLSGKAVVVIASFEKSNSRWRDLRIIALSGLVFFLAIVSSHHISISQTFDYHGIARWSGVWMNPDIYGLLMGTGLVLGTGLAYWVTEIMTINQVWRCLLVSLYFVASLFLGFGLLKSYSRGAWLGTSIGLTFLIASVIRREYGIRISNISWLNRNWISLSVIVLVVAGLSFWLISRSPVSFLQRSLSPLNVNDFSWRNRIVAWEGTLQIIADHPWLGAGWNRAGALYQNYHLPSRIHDPTAFYMNDYLQIGATLGIPALLCFCAYLYLSLTSTLMQAQVETDKKQKPSTWCSGFQKWNVQNSRLAPPCNIMPPDNCNPLSHVICQAGATVLIVGIWFDDGLFELSSAFVFWLLLEMGIPRKLHQTGSIAARRKSLTTGARMGELNW